MCIAPASAVALEIDGVAVRIAHNADERRQARDQRSRVIIDDLRHYLEARNRQVSAKAKLGEAIRYVLTCWDGLSRFLDDGRVDLDSNAVERSIRPLALNRKNALFASSDEGGDNWAVIATHIENCKLSGITPHTWLTEILTKPASGHPANAVSELMPWAAVGLKTPVTTQRNHQLFLRLSSER